MENASSLNDCYTLSNGVTIPCIGFGTWKLLEDECINAVKTAIQAGYRHIDTATAYRNEKSVGIAIKESDVPRSELFITSKLWNSSKGYDETIKAFKKTLTFLDTEYLDLYLIHWPRSLKHMDNYEQLNSDTWKAFETLYKDGYIRAIGVSNFLKHHLMPLLDTASIVPMVDQLELSPQCRQDTAVEFARSLGMITEAYSPLTRGNIFETEQIAALKQKHKRSASQICLRWSIQMGYLPLPKAASHKHIEENTDIFSFSLDDEDMKLLDELKYLGRMVADPDNPPF